MGRTGEIMADLTHLAKGQVSPATVLSHRAWVSVSIRSGINAQMRLAQRGVAVHLTHEGMEGLEATTACHLSHEGTEALEATTACHPSGVGAPATEQIF